MTIESPVNYITDLDQTYPADGDFIPEGDNHIRNVKKAVKQTLPNANAPINATPTELNSLVGRQSFMHDFLQAATKSIARTALNIETTIRGSVSRLFTATQIPSYRTHLVSTQTVAVSWDASLYQTIFLTIDTAADPVITWSGVQKGAFYTLHIVNTVIGRTVSHTGVTVVDGDNAIALDNTAARNVMSFFAESATVLRKLGQENYS